MNKSHIIKSFWVAFAGVSLLLACKPEEELVQQTRLFMPVLKKDLSVLNNTIIVNMAGAKTATGYAIEVSRDTFKTVDYKINADTNYVVVNEKLLKGESLFWNTLYQVRATALAADAIYNSKVSDLGSVKTDKFPSILIVPTSADLLDVSARVKWNISTGIKVAKVKVFAKTDLKLANPLASYDVSDADQKTGITIVKKLLPETTYQLAIYDATGKVQGWDNYTTIKQAVDTKQSNVIDLSESDDPTALNTALSNAVDGGIIVLKKGATYTMPTTAFTKSVWITSAYGFGEQKTIITTSGGGVIADGSTIDYIRFSNVEIKGADIGASYVFNPDRASVTLLKELTFDNCILSNMRGVLRMRTKFFLTNFNIKNSIVYQIGNYGILTTDTDGTGMAAVDNIAIQNSTFSKINIFLTSRQSSKSVLISDCTLNEVGSNTNTSVLLFNWRGTTAATNNVTNGIKISNCVWGGAWDQAGTPTAVSIRAKSATSLATTNFTVENTYGLSTLTFVAGTEITGFPTTVYAKTATDLWVSPNADLNFNFKDLGFAGRKDTGDPRWRIK
ncbi:DUF5123 domain-containing protein [Arcicella aurantiaca]|nr:DUF5123 domain-containing protein [Arcicella aurantiaca]